jgi:hypothetical protein
MPSMVNNLVEILKSMDLKLWNIFIEVSDEGLS